ncbi:SURF1 family protein [Demequina sp.]|uniref:SURF1 family protein n=1 Tax=Demequina sp. TaxID=2050685 RepID=UPI003D0EEB39
MPSSSRVHRALTVVGIGLFAIAVSVTAVFLGQWQYHRHEARAAEIDYFEAGQAAAPAPLNDVVPDGVAEFPQSARWRVATVSGTFDTESLTWLRNRPVNSSPASHALAWFVTDDGRALLVDAGWVEPEATGRPSLPTEHLDLTVTMRPTEDDNGTPGTRITPAQMPAAPGAVVPGYGVLAEACLDPCGALPGLSITPLPPLSLGPHLAYTVQWYMLAVAAPIVAIVWSRRELKGDKAPSAPTKPKRRAVEPTDEEIEDAL